MTDADQSGPAPTAAADAELRDAMESVEAIGEDWRSSERGIDDDDEEHGDGGSEEG